MPVPAPTAPKPQSARTRRHTALSAGLRAAALAGVLGFALSGCVGAVIGGGAAVGVAAYQERGVEGVSRDLRMDAQITEAYLRHNHEMLTHIGITVFEGRVLATGQVDDAQMQADAVRLAWTVPGVTEVLNEIQVSPSGSALDTARDAWISAQLKAKLTFDKDVLAINYTVETVGGVVYVIGIAQNRAELARVIGHARSIDYVERVVNHVRVKGEA